jgi:hypothetical protein
MVTTLKSGTDYRKNISYFHMNFVPIKGKSLLISNVGCMGRGTCLCRDRGINIVDGIYTFNLYPNLHLL